MIIPRPIYSSDELIVNMQKKGNVEFGQNWPAP